MKISWLGHAAFRITSGNGTSIITDPYEPATSGYAPYREPADVVIISSATDDFHNNTHIEPSIKRGERYWDMTAQFARKLGQTCKRNAA